MNIALLANLKKNAPTWPGISPDYWDDLDSESTIKSISAALESAGHKVTFLEGDATLAATITKLKPDFCFNICEGHFGDARESFVPATLDMLRIPYTGSGALTLALALDKPMTKRVLTYHNLPTPDFQVFENLNEPLDESLAFPLFVKPSREGTGMGVSSESIVYSEAELRTQLRKLFERYDHPVLAEQYIEGREITLGLVGNLATPTARRIPSQKSDRVAAADNIHLFPPLEVDMEAYPEEEAGIYTNRIKVELVNEFHYKCPAPLTEDQLEILQRLTLSTFRVMGCWDVARVDFRLDANDNFKPYILEINPLPGLNATYSDLCIESAAYGWSYETLINRILDEAVERYQR